MTRVAYASCALLPALVAAGLLASGWWTFFAPAVVFGVLPVVEWALGERREQAPAAQLAEMARDPRYTQLLHLFAWVHFALLAVFFARVERSDLSLVELCGLCTSMGVSCGAIAINVAHELGHRRRAIDRRMAMALLHSSFYPQFHLEHNRGHHVYVATGKDPATAPLGMSLYRFFFRAVPGVLRGAHRVAAEPLIARGKSAWSWRNALLQQLALQLALMVAVALLLSPVALLAWLGAGAFGVVLLETVDYVEHYGLRRERGVDGSYEPVRPRHSWNSDHLLGRLLLFELPRHSDHHAHAARPFQALRTDDGAPRLPGGYPTMMVLAALPPLWFRVMDPRARTHRAPAPQSEESGRTDPIRAGGNA